MLKKIKTIKTELLTLPNPIRLLYLKLINNKYKKQIFLLKQNGYIDLGKILTDKMCDQISHNINKEIKNENYENISKSKIYIIKNFVGLEDLINSIFTDNIENIISGYFSRKVFLSDFDIRRVFPTDYSNLKSSSSNFHKDGRGRQIKLMLYLSDVEIKDSYFSFIPKTHKTRKYGLDQSRIKDNEIKNLKNITINWLGKKGSAMLFDTNLIHKLNRNNNATIRDSITLYFTPGQHRRILTFKNFNLLNPSIKNIIKT